MMKTVDPLKSENLSQAVNDLIAEGGRALELDDERAGAPTVWDADTAGRAVRVRARLLAKYSIAYNGRQYETCGYRYDRLADAVCYARQQRAQSRALHARQRRRQLPAETGETPDEAQRLLMSKLGIQFESGSYRFGGFRYERLSDVVAYARSQWRPLKP